MVWRTRSLTEEVALIGFEHLLVAKGQQLSVNLWLSILIDFIGIVGIECSHVGIVFSAQ